MDSEHRLIRETMPFTEEDTRRSWYYFLSTLLLSAAAFYGTYSMVSVEGKIIMGLLAGLITSRLFVIYHDFHHDAILRRSVAANVLMTMIGTLALAPPGIWKESHQHHHNHNSKFSRIVIGSFPTITTQTFRSYTVAQRQWYLLLRHPLMIVFAYLPVFLVSFCLWPFFENPRKYYDCGIAVIVHILIGWILFYSGGWTLVVFSLILPCTVMFAIGAYIFYAQHNFPEVILREDDEWQYFEAAMTSSSFIKMNRVMRWFTANIGYHHIHHVNSRIPFYRLPEAMEKIPEFQHPRSTSLHPREIWRCLQLKVWDNERGRLISLKELKN